MGWGQLKDGFKPAWMLGYTYYSVILFPDLFPGIAFDTHELQEHALVHSASVDGAEYSLVE